MPNERHELTIPPETKGDPKSFEILRVWAASKEQHITIRSDLKGGAAGFGCMLADLAHHGAILYAQREEVTKSVALAAILEAFKCEIDDNAGDVKGHIPD
jgi:hypothetical protein